MLARADLIRLYEFLDRHPWMEDAFAILVALTFWALFFSGVYAAYAPPG